jgi:hypothetical protein
MEKILEAPKTGRVEDAAKERPILFSAPMVRAILEGKKTQTRRLVKPQPVGGDTIVSKGMEPGWMVGQLRDSENAWRDLRCPYGQPGDRLWVRETWSPHTAEKGIRYAVFKDGGQQYEDGVYAPGLKEYAPGAFHRVKWKPSIHMPRWASRLSLGVTSVRVERLQDITEADAIAEGATFTDFGKDRWGNQHPGWTMEPPALDQVHCLGGARWAFANLINKINGPETWDANPWVWVVEFRRLDNVPTARSAPEALAEGSPS